MAKYVSVRDPMENAVDRPMPRADKAVTRRGCGWKLAIVM